LQTKTAIPAGEIQFTAEGSDGATGASSTGAFASSFS
jgi:hypothetical protein